MEAIARARFQRMSPRKVRRVAALVRGKPVDEAIALLDFVPKAAAVPLQKTIKSAVANALAVEGTAKLKSEDLAIRVVKVDGGPVLKRIRAVGMGRAYRIRKPTCHITVVVAGEPKPVQLRGARRTTALKTPKPKGPDKEAPAARR